MYRRLVMLAVSLLTAYVALKCHYGGQPPATGGAGGEPGSCASPGTVTRSEWWAIPSVEAAVRASMTSDCRFSGNSGHRSRRKATPPSCTEPSRSPRPLLSGFRVEGPLRRVVSCRQSPKAIGRDLSENETQLFAKQRSVNCVMLEVLPPARTSGTQCHIKGEVSLQHRCVP